MDHFAGLDVSVKETSVCIVDDTGKIVREVKVASEPEALLPVLKNPAYRFKRIGLEAGPLSQWLFSALAEAELPVVCVETRHMQAALKAQINKTATMRAASREARSKSVGVRATGSGLL
jgi:transposase